ncbi:MAG TPA: hypothetical protein VL549_07145 [Gemmatimonadales bacterium]|nr:hypothetical protein [Gemmatimonadales bacterium]
MLRWTARLSSLAVIGLIVLFAFDGHSGKPTPVEMLGILFFPGLICIGFLLGWWREDVGALVATVGLIGIYVWSKVVAGHFPRGPWFVVFWSPALLFMAAWLVRRSAHVAALQPPNP